MSYALNKYRDLRYKHDEKITEAIMASMVALSFAEQRDLWIFDQDAGILCVYQDPRFPQYVIEYIKGSDEDSVTTLFETAPLFGDRSRLREARIEIMQEIASHFLSLPSVLTVYDEGRGRQVYLRELGTMQLLDVLAHVSSKEMIKESFHV